MEHFGPDPGASCLSDKMTGRRRTSSRGRGMAAGGWERLSRAGQWQVLNKCDSYTTIISRTLCTQLCWANTSLCPGAPG